MNQTKRLGGTGIKPIGSIETIDFRTMVTHNLFFPIVIEKHRQIEVISIVVDNNHHLLSVPFYS